MKYDKIFRSNADFLNLLRFYKGINKIELGKYLNLSMPTIYKTLDDLDDAGIVNKKELSVYEDYGTLCGISIGSSLCKIVFLDMNFCVFSATKFASYKKVMIRALENGGLKNDPLLSKCSSDESKNYIYFCTPDNFSILKDSLDIIFECIKTWHDDESFLNFLSIGISCTGVINEQNHTIVNGHLLEYLNNTPLSKLIYPNKQTYFTKKEIDIYLVQNANAAMIAEKIALYHTNSEFKNKKNIMALYLGGGIGAGLYFGKIYSGACGYSGEIGHIATPYFLKTNSSFDADTKSTDMLDARCTCGNKDCFEHRIRTDVFRKSHKDFCYMSSVSIADELKKDPEKQKAKLFGTYLGYMVNICTNLLNLDLIIFTGKFYKSMDIVMNDMVKVLDENHLKFNQNACDLLVSKQGPKSSAMGAAIYAYHMKYDLELSWEYNI